MTLAPLIDAGVIIFSHSLAAITAFVLGIVQFLAPKGTIPHRIFGYIWCALMLWAAGSSFLIHDIRLIGPFSPIHILSILVVFGVISGIREARRSDIKEHRKTMVLLFSSALVVAGVLAFMPGRIMHEVAFGK